MREKIGVATTLAGVLAALPSVWQTVTHITDQTYRTPEVRHGAGHVQYHMARETLVTAGAFAVILDGLTEGQHRSSRTWRTMAMAAVGFIAAMWSGGPTTGVWAPNRGALLIHLASSTGLAAGILLLLPRSRRRS